MPSPNLADVSPKVRLDLRDDPVGVVVGVVERVEGCSQFSVGRHKRRRPTPTNHVRGTPTKKRAVPHNAIESLDPVGPADLSFCIGPTLVADTNLIGTRQPSAASLAVTSGSKPNRSSSISIDWITSRRNAL